MFNFFAQRLIRSAMALIIATLIGAGSMAQAHAGASSWTIVPSPNLGTSSDQLTAVSVASSSDAWAVGAYYANNTVFWSTLTEHWNGTAWSVVHSPNSGTAQDYLYGVDALSSTNVWAVGTFFNGNAYEPLTEHWNGIAWSVIATPAADGDTLYAVSGTSSTDVWAVGGGDAGALTMHWNGTSWSLVANPASGTARAQLRAVTALSSGNVRAVGFSPVGYGSSNALAEGWNGTEWFKESTPPADSLLSGLTSTSGATFWAVGAQRDSERTLAEQFTGGAWSAVSTPNSGEQNDYLNAVVAVSASDVWSVGATYLRPQTLIEQWNGTQWSIVSSPRVGDAAELLGVARSPDGAIWAVGDYSPVNGNGEQTLILRNANG